MNPCLLRALRTRHPQRLAGENDASARQEGYLLAACKAQTPRYWVQGIEKGTEESRKLTLNPKQREDSSKA